MYRDSQQQSDNESGQINRISASALRMREIFQSFQFLVVFANECSLNRTVPMGTQASGLPPARCGQNHVVRPADTSMIQGQVFPASGGMTGPW